MGITYENAIAYCNWLTQQFNINPNRQFKKVLFRLPTQAEWVYAANGGDINKLYAWDSPYILDRHKGYMCNFSRLGDETISYNETAKAYQVKNSGDEKLTPRDRRPAPCPVKNYDANKFGLYNMCGNVAEMVSERGIAKGGSYNDLGYDVRIASVKHFIAPSAEIGFRVAMEIVEK